MDNTKTGINVAQDTNQDQQNQKHRKLKRHATKISG